MQKNEKLDKLYWSKKQLEQRKLELEVEKAVLKLQSKKLRNENGREEKKVKSNKGVYGEDYGLHIS